MILLDRDGVLNRMVVDPEHGTIDSPLHPSQIEIIPDVPESLALLSRAGFGLAIVTNQPASAKGKTTRQNLQDTHDAVVTAVQAKGGRILSSHICFHRAEDSCSCRKPKTGLLEEAFQKNPTYSKSGSWMVGDGVGDIQAGQTFGVQTVFIGPRKDDAAAIFHQRALKPDRWETSLAAFTSHLVPGITKETR